jgi:hypothetical protein
MKGRSPSRNPLLLGADWLKAKSLRIELAARFGREDSRKSGIVLSLRASNRPLVKLSSTTFGVQPIIHNARHDRQTTNLISRNSSRILAFARTEHSSSALTEK